MGKPDAESDSHFWVREVTGDKLEAIFCYYCGQHQVEVPDWGDMPVCEGLRALRKAAALTGGEKGGG